MTSGIAVLGLAGQAWKFVKSLTAWIGRPRLTLYFDPTRTFEKVPVQDAGGVMGFFCHLVVKNQGKKRAKNCQGELVWVGLDDRREHPEFRARRTLKWANEPDFGARDIEGGDDRRLDLCYVLQTQPDLVHFFTPKGPAGVRTDFPAGKYALMVRVLGENARPATERFILGYTGVWNQVEIRQLD